MLLRYDEYSLKFVLISTVRKGKKNYMVRKDRKEIASFFLFSFFILFLKKYFSLYLKLSQILRNFIFFRFFLHFSIKRNEIMRNFEKF